MKILLFGGTGMVGQGVLRECLLDGDVKSVVSVVRKASGQKDAKLREVVHPNFDDFSGLGAALDDVDACFYTLGVTSAGTSELDYDRITYGYTVAAAKALVARSPKAVFVFVSGVGTNANSKVMWSRIKGKAENAVLETPFRRTVVFRPGVIQPLHGIRSRTWIYNAGYAVTRPLFPVVRALFPNSILTTELIGRAMLVVAKEQGANAVLEPTGIRELAARYTDTRTS